MVDGGHKVCGRDVLWTVSEIAFKFDAMVLWAFLMIWLAFVNNSLKTRWLTEDILKKMAIRKASRRDIL